MNQTDRPKSKVCYVLSYKDPNYIRTRVLTKAAERLSDVDLYKVINSTKGSGRYIETLWRLIKTRLKHRPDVYILGFRGQEIFWPVRLLTIGKPLIFDEFINMHDWLGEENGKLPAPLIMLADIYERWALKSSRLVLTDTKLGARKSAETYGIRPDKFRTIYVGADEDLFKSRPSEPKGKRLEVFFYGNMAPLHGLKIILNSALSLKDAPVRFTIVGGRGKQKDINYIRKFINENQLENVDYKEWMDFEKLPQAIAKCDVFLGGPFGNTSQAKRVITGKTFQALAVGTPVIVGRIDEKAGFDDKLNCLLVEQGSPEVLAQAISWASENRSELKKLGENGRELFDRKFSTRRVAEGLDEIIKEVTKR